MRKIFVIVTGLLISRGVHAQTINLTSDNRSVSVSGLAVASPLPATNYSSSQAPTAAFGNFQGNVSGSAQAYYLGERPSASSGATQNSTMTGSGIDFNSSLFVMGQGSGSGGEGVLALANSSFDVSFTVTSPTVFILTFPTAGGMTAYSQFNPHFGFLSANNGSVSAIVDSDQTGLPGMASSYSGILEPGSTYTIDVSLQLGTYAADPIGGYYDYNYGFSLATTPFGIEVTSTPEPSPVMLLGMGTALAGFAGLARKRFKK